MLIISDGSVGETWIFFFAGKNKQKYNKILYFRKSNNRPTSVKIHHCVRIVKEDSRMSHYPRKFIKLVNQTHLTAMADLFDLF